MKLNLHRGGAGETLVLLHGIGARWGMWEPVLATLEARFDVIALDLPGFADSAMPTPVPAAGTASLCDLVLESLEELGVTAGEFHVAGNSLGGGMALELARRGVVRSACALSPAGFASRLETTVAQVTLRSSVRIARRLAPRADALTARPRARILLAGTFFAHPDRIPRAAAAADLRALAGASWFDATLSAVRPWRFAASEIAAPVTIAWGSKDRVLWPRQAERARAALPGARIVSLPGCGHVPTWDDPPLVAEVMLEAAGAA